MINRDYAAPRVSIPPPPREQGQSWAYAKDVISHGDYPASFVAQNASRWHLRQDDSGDLVYVREDR